MVEAPLIADIDEKVRMIDKHIVLVKHTLNQQEITSGQDRALFHAMNLMLKERKELVELKERAVLSALRERVLLDNVC